MEVENRERVAIPNTYRTSRSNFTPLRARFRTQAGEIILRERASCANASQHRKSIRALFKKREYIAAVHAGVSRDYIPMTKIFREVIARTLKSVAKASSV